MARYAEFDPEPGRPVPVRVRLATVDDAEIIAAIGAERDGADPADVVPLIRASLAAGAQVWVAEVNGEVAGYGRVTRIDGEAQLGSRNVATGFYLAGVIVAVRHRRRGVGRALTEERTSWIAAQGAMECFAVINAANRASLALHDGFEVVTRDLVWPGLPHHGGTRVLVRKAL